MRWLLFERPRCNRLNHIGSQYKRKGCQPLCLSSSLKPAHGRNGSTRKGKRKTSTLVNSKSFAPGLFQEFSNAQKEKFRAEGKPPLHRSVYEWLVNNLHPDLLPGGNVAYDGFFDTWYKAHQCYAHIAYGDISGRADVATPSNSIPSKGSSSGIKAESDDIKMGSGSESESETESKPSVSISPAIRVG